MNQTAARTPRATQEYMKYRQEIEALLKEVRLKLGQHAQDQAYEPNSYAYVGDLGHVKALLEEIDDFLS